MGGGGWRVAGGRWQVEFGQFRSTASATLKLSQVSDGHCCLMAGTAINWPGKQCFWKSSSIPTLAKLSYRKRLVMLKMNKFRLEEATSHPLYLS